jgi:hypothetical protein
MEEDDEIRSIVTVDPIKPSSPEEAARLQEAIAEENELIYLDKPRVSSYSLTENELIAIMPLAVLLGIAIALYNLIFRR